MIRNHLHHSGLRARVLSGTTAAAVCGIVALSSFGNGADAAGRSQSTAIADVAGQAVDALDRYEQTLNPVDYVRFVQYRDQAASMTEADIELADGTLREAWAKVSLAKQEAVLGAVSQLGVPYRYLASEPGVAFDCSGLTIWAFGAAGVDIPRVSRDQINAAEEVDREDAEAGDLVYYPGHISIFLGADTMVHSPNSGSEVEVAPLSDKSLRFGDAEAAQSATESQGAPATGGATASGSLVDRTVTVSK